MSLSQQKRQKTRESWFRSKKHRSAPTEKKWQAFLTLCEGDNDDVDDDGHFDSLQDLIEEAEALIAEPSIGEKGVNDDKELPDTVQHFSHTFFNTALFVKAASPPGHDVL